MNGKRHGKFKEYDNNKLIFEGEFLNDKRWNGKGKEYDDDGNLEFDGKYLKGIKCQNKYN